jgi:phage I-like protein
MSVLPQDPAAQPPAPSATQDVKPTENMIPKSRLDEVIAQRDAATKKAEALEKAQQDAEKKRLEEANQYKELYEKTQAELTSLKPKAEQVDDYEKTLSDVLAEQVAELPEEFRDVIPDGLSTKQKLDWLAKNKSKFMKADPFDIGAGKRGTKPDKKFELTAEEKELAKRFGMSEEDYAKNK